VDALWGAKKQFRGIAMAFRSQKTGNSDKEVIGALWILL
jgi:hypothetical protein